MRIHTFFACLLIMMVCSAWDPAAAQLDSHTGSEMFNPLPGRSNDTAWTTGWISGEVVSYDGRPVGSATVEIHGDAAKPDSAYTGPDGKFELHNIPTGQWELIARTGKRIDEARDWVRVTPGLNVVTLTFPPDTTTTGSGQATISAAQLAVPDKARSEFQKAEDSLRKGKLNDAARCLEKALTLWPRFAEALTLRAVVEHTQNSSDLAEADAQKAIEYDPNYGKAYAVLGSIYTDSKRWDDAFRALDHGIAVAPDYWPNYYEMSKALLLRGDFARTLHEADKASSLVHGEYAPLHLVKGYAYIGLKNASAARTELEAYIKLETDPTLVSRVKQQLARLSASAADTQNSAGSSSPNRNRSSVAADEAH